MKVLIADDELKVCRLIEHLVDWDALEMEIVGIVNDGKAALEAVIQKKPDIVITDIRMPSYDGLELVRRTKELHPDIDFIVISGYSQFEYAQQAIKYGVKDYLLKPLKKRDLENALNEIKESHESRVLNNQKQEEIQSMIQASREHVRENFLLKILQASKNSPISREVRVQEVNRQYGCHFVEGFFTAVRIRPFFSDGAVEEDAEEFLMNKVHQLVKDKIGDCCMEFLSTVYGDEMVYLLNTDTRDFTQIEKNFKHIKIDLCNFKEIFREVNLVIGVGGTYCSMGGIEESLQEAQYALMNRMGQRDSFYIAYTPDSSSRKSCGDIFDSAIRTGILNCQERMDVEGVKIQIQNLKAALEPYKYDGKLVYECFLELAQTLQFGVKNYRDQMSVPFTENYRKHYRTLMTFEDLFQWILSDIDREYTIYMKNVKEAESKPIRDAKKYIYDHFNKHISLESVSEQIGFNSAYFSTLFKKETGKNFLEYVTELRMQNAKNYLIQTDYDIAEVAAAVGYSDLKYFSKLFKKMTGLSPSEYRKLYS